MKSRILTCRSASCFVTRASLSKHDSERTFDVKARPNGLADGPRTIRPSGCQQVDCRPASAFGPTWYRIADGARTPHWFGLERGAGRLPPPQTSGGGHAWRVTGSEASGPE